MFGVILAEPLPSIFLTCEVRVEERESLKTSTRNVLDSPLLPEAVLLSRTCELLRKLNSLGGQSLHAVPGLCLKVGHLRALFCVAVSSLIKSIQQTPLVEGLGRRTWRTR